MCPRDSHTCARNEMMRPIPWMNCSMDADKPLAGSAVLIVDVVNDFAFAGSDQLLQQMPRVVRAIDALRRRADALQRPVIHVNDTRTLAFQLRTGHRVLPAPGCARCGHRGTAQAARH